MYLGDLPIGHTVRQVHARRPMHRVPDRILVLMDRAGDSVLKQDIEELCEGADWYACTLFADGRGLMRGRDIMARRPGEQICQRMLDLAVMLNAEINHDGHWVTVWCGGRLHAIWRDGDGDAQFSQTFEEPWARIARWPVTEFADRCEAAWSEYRRMVFSDVGVTPAETILRAQGEKAATRH